MQLEVGSILEGKITGVKNFGAFVRLPDGTTGMVHISEVSNEYIQELSDVLNEGQMVNVKVMSISPEGKVALSIKRTQERPAGNGGAANSAPRAPRPQRSSRPADTGRVWQPRQAPAPSGEPTFEDMMSKFKTQSEEKISDLKRVTEARRGGGYSRRR
ncbi:S1 RNA-binding domain-containing protein [Ruminococcaceae bacterium OttesenSCG-928-A16]|nr:S1 RNA-binding domain-containing protein [Ruminococcaceae bacterium OttesenSCG-928-A16]